MATLSDKISSLAKDYRLADIYVFGSRAGEISSMVREDGTSSGQNSSDADIAVRPLAGTHLLPKEIVSLTLELEDLLDVNRVDLVLLPTADPFLALEAIRGELIFVRDAIDQARYELYVLRRASDLLPFKKARLEAIIRGSGR